MQTWIHNEILDGLSRLLCLGLERTPPADLLPGTAMAWYLAITQEHQWDQQRDTERFRQAFLRLAQVRRIWPVPADFIAAIPPCRLNPIVHQPCLSRPDAPHMRRLFQEINGLLKRL